MKDIKPSDFPDHRELMKIVVEFGRMEPKNDHIHAVQLVCSSALEHYRGIINLCRDNNSIPAKALSRVLFETLVMAVVLAKSPQKLQDFKECGRYLHLRSLKSDDWETREDLATLRQNIISTHGADYAALHKKFGRTAWHGMTRSAAIKEAGFISDMYDIFYWPTSAFIHADPSRYVMRNLNDEWVFGRSDVKEAVFLLGAFVSSTQILSEALGQLNQIFSLPFAARLETFKTKLYEFALKYRDAVLAVSVSRQYSLLPKILRQALK